MSRREFRHDLLSLRLFVAACELRSLSKAAERTHMAVSAASRRLFLLEEEMGTALVKRLPHGLEPTMAGLTALRYSQSVLRMGDQLATALDEYRSGARGRVRIFASSSALVQRLAADLAAFSRSHPDIKIDLEERPTIETLEALNRKQADLGVIVRGISTEGMRCYPYSQDRLAVAVFRSHPLARRKKVRLADLVDEDFVALDGGTAVHRLVVEKASELGRVLKLRVQVRSFEAMCQMVAQELGIGILPDAALRPLAEALGLKLIALEERWAVRDISICVPAAEAPAPPTARLLEALLPS
jgi:DNA-binding transcriptional LysR family regulator